MLTQEQFDQKKLNKRLRREKSIAALRHFAQGKDLSLFGESKSGIPLGQPILVGHHSEKRHRRHLERINNLVRRGYAAADKADRLQARLDNESNAITCDNPSALSLIQDKINKLEKWRAEKKASGNYKSWELTNSGAEIRRLKKRLIEVEKAQQGFEEFTAGNISVTFDFGQIQVMFPKKPSEEIRKTIKNYPYSLKWSSYSMRWVRKHTGSTGPRYREELKKYLESLNL